MVRPVASKGNLCTPTEAKQVIPILAIIMFPKHYRI